MQNAQNSDFVPTRQGNRPQREPSLFQDNKEDVAFLESGEGAQAIIILHVEGIFRYLQQ